MNILIVHNYYRFPGGEDAVVFNESEALKRRGHKIFMYTRNNSDINTDGLVNKAKLAVNAIWSKKTYQEVKAIIKNNNIDIVHVHNTVNLISPSVYYAAKDMRVPVVQTMHNFRHLCPAGTFFHKGKLCEKCVKGGLRCAVMGRCYRDSLLETLVSTLSIWFGRVGGIYKHINYICLTRFNKSKLLMIREYIDPEKIFIKPNFIPEDASHERLTKNEKQDYYIFVGRLEEIKGIDTLIAAWKLMGENAPRLILLGSGDKYKEILAASESGKLPHIEVRGQVPKEEVLERVSKARALVFTSRVYETFGMSIAESYSVGTPVIAGRIGNGGRMVKDGVTGYRFDYKSPESLKETILKMEKLSSSERNAMGQNALEIYEKYFTEKANMDKLESIYEKARI